MILLDQEGRKCPLTNFSGETIGGGGGAEGGSA